MHNWLEGVLEHHLRTLWGIGRDRAHDQRANELDEDEAWDESDVAESASELEELVREADEYAQQVQQGIPPGPPTPSSSEMSVDSDPQSTPTQTPMPTSPENPDTADPDDGEYIEMPEGVYSLPEAFVDALRICISNISLPTWVDRPPGNLGEAKHGKLKAYTYMTLFSAIFPLIVPEFWHPPRNETDLLHMESFHNLVVATNIVCSYKMCNADADLYTHYYAGYREIIQKLFTFWHSLPNHHFAMHNGDFLKYWGPLPSLSEFPGERLIGMLQDINTSQRLRKFTE